MIVVQKYGGSSVATPEKIAAVAKRVAKRAEKAALRAAGQASESGAVELQPPPKGADAALRARFRSNTARR